MPPRPAVFWSDLLLSAGLGWCGLVAAMRCSSLPATVLCCVVSTLALYRAVLFIHELTHLRPRSLPGFRSAWNALVGVPLMLPSFMYVGVHQDHHHPLRYGTKEDPEYYTLVPGTLGGIVGFVLVAGLAPLALWIRFALLTPLGAALPAVKRFAVERVSALATNPFYKRQPPKEGSAAREWAVLETLTSLWCWSVALSAWRGALPLRAFVCFAAVGVGIALINQLRTLVVHRWEQHDESLTLEEQLLDSVNYPGSGLFTELWAPLGQRYHALHHLLPGLPYHSLPEAHRRLQATLPHDSAYHQTTSASFLESVRTLFSKL